MPERTIKSIYYTTLDGESYNQGQVVDLTEDEAKRGDSLGAFEESDKPLAGGTDITGTGGIAAGGGPSVQGLTSDGADPGSWAEQIVASINALRAEVGDEQAQRLLEEAREAIEGVESDTPAAEPGDELAPDEVDRLAGEELDAHVEAAGIDVSTGGSLAGGSLSADEKRQALKEHFAS